MSRRLKIALALAAGLVLLALAFYGVDISAVRANVASARPDLLALGAVLYLTAYFVRSLRWRLILRPVCSTAVSESFFMLMAGYFLNYVIPIRAGEVAKSFFLKRLKGVPVAVSLPTVFVDKLFELVSIVFIVLMVPVLSIRMEPTLAGLIVTVLAVFLMAVAVLVAAFRNQEATTAFLCKMFSWLPGHLYDRLAEWLGLFVRGMGVARENLKALGGLLFLTALAVAIDALYFFTMFKAFGIDVAFTRVLFGYTLLSLSYILPTPPAQIGYNEFVIGLIFAGGLALASVPRDQVMAVIVVAHAMTGAIITLVGLWSFGAMGIRVGESFKRVSGGPSGVEEGAA